MSALAIIFQIGGKEKYIRIGTYPPKADIIFF